MSCVWVTSRLRGKRSARSRVGGVEVVDREPEAARVAADVVEREQPRVAVEGGVLDALGHHRRRRLLEARDERRGGALEQPARRRASREHLRGPRRDGPTVARCRCGRPAARRARARGRSTRSGASRASRSTSGANVVRRLLELGLVGVLARTAARRRRARPTASVSGASPAGSTNSAADVVEELVADRPVDRPVAQLLAGVEDLLHPHVLDAAVAQPLEVARRDRPARPGGRSAARRRRPRAPARSASRCVSANTSGSSWRTPARWSMSKKRRWRPGLRVDVEELRAQLRVGPVAVGVVGRHVVRDDVEHDPQPGLARGARRARGTPPRRRARSEIERRVDHVVAVRRALRAPGTTAAGRGARRRGRAGTARARAPRRSRSRRRAGGGRSRGSSRHRARAAAPASARRPVELLARGDLERARLGVGLGGAQHERPARRRSAGSAA